MTDPNEKPFVLPMAVPGTGSDAPVAAPSRGPAFGARRAIAAEHPLAALAAIDVLRRGGNAIDAAIAASAVKVVVKPYWTQLGGDAFVLIWHRSTGAVECLNAGGRASRHATPDRFASGIPHRGPLASTVPGLVDAWCELRKRHGRLPLADLLAPAIELAERGFAVTRRLAGATRMLAAGTEGLEDPATRRTFLHNDRAYEEGETLRQPELAETLRAIAAEGREGFYSGVIGQSTCSAMRTAGGMIDEDDLAQPLALWHEPLSTSYRGVTVYEQALPSQGIILLQALNILEQFELPNEMTGAHTVHLLAEATRLAFADARRHIADPLVEDVPLDMLLSKERAAARTGEIDMARANAATPALAPADTTSFAVADGDTAVAFIQSVYWPWGSGFTIPGTGILMNNRMTGFRTEPSHPNCVAPGKRTVHTLNMFLAVRDDELLAGGGTPGGDYQVQTNLQTITGIVDYGLDIQSAIDAPKWATLGRSAIAMESRFPDATLHELSSRGHDVRRLAAWDAALARSQFVASMPGPQGWAAASDSRGEGIAIAE